MIAPNRSDRTPGSEVVLPAPEVVTFGETMGLIQSIEPGRLRHTSGLRLGIGGAESNTAIGLARQEHSVAWMGRVGNDEVGNLVLATLRGEGVDVTRSTRDPDAPTGLMIRWKPSPLSTEVAYYRTGSAASRITPSHLSMESIESARVLYLTGITSALGPGAHEAMLVATEAARAAGTIVAFDPNFRKKLWTPEQAAPLILEIVQRSDLVLAGLDESVLLFGDGDAATIGRQLLEHGAKEVVIRDGLAETTVIHHDGVMRQPVAATPSAVDPVGAGDAFTAGYVSALLEGLATEERVDRAARTASRAVRAFGDWEGLPTLDELTSDPRGDVIR